MMQPSRVVEAQAELMSRLHTNPDFKELMIGQMAMQMASTDHEGQAQVAFETLRSDLRGAYAYRVSREMGALIQHAAAVLDGTEHIDHEDIPTGCGIVYIDGGLDAIDARGRPMKINWFVWGPALYTDGPGVAFWMFNDMIECPDEIATEVLTKFRKHARRALGRWGYVGMGTMSWGQRVGPRSATPAPAHVAEILADGGTPSTEGTNSLRLLYAFWLMLQQTIAVTTQMPKPPNLRALAKKARIPGQCTVVELRRREYVGEDRPDATGRHVSVRFMVRGFWRWQTYGPGRTLRKRIWVSDFMKGPDDAPLKIGPKVYDLRR